MRYLRQRSQYRDLRHLKALAWMVSALIAGSGRIEPLCLGTLCASAPNKPKHRAPLAKVHAQRPDSGGSALSAC